MLYFYVNQSKNVGKVGKIMFDFMGNVDIMIPADDKSLFVEKKVSCR